MMAGSRHQVQSVYELYSHGTMLQRRAAVSCRLFLVALLLVGWARGQIVVLVTELCADFCAGSDCKVYHSPLCTCFSGQERFPNDPSWGDIDFYDEIVDGESLKRTMFASNNGTCVEETDSFSLPLHECVGPFGKPRPWGQFYVLGGPNNGSEQQ